MRLRSFWHFNRVTFFVLDYALLWGAVVCAFKLSPRYAREILLGPWLNPELQFIGYGLPLLMAFGLQVTGMQRIKASFRPTETLAQTLAGLAGGMLAFVVIHAVAEFGLIGRYVLLFSLCYGTGFIVCSRMLVWKLAEQQVRKILFYGSPAAAAALKQEINRSNLPIRLVDQMQLDKLLPTDAAEFGKLKQLSLYARLNAVEAEDIVVEVPPDALTTAEREALLFCTRMGVSVLDLGYFFERELERVHVAGLREAWFWGYDPAYAHPVYFAVKRTLDVVISLMGMLAFAPVAPIVVALIKLQDGGPAIYSQVRVGLHNEHFRIYKFRTMRLDAETNGAQWAKVNDDRTTWFGRLLRKTRVDEVPQFWNILRGDMSFIGPRPERPEFVGKIEAAVPFYSYRHLIKPGLTGWAQINYPYGASIEDARQKLAYDLYYMKYGTITRELQILLRTIVAMMQGAR